MKPAGHNKTAEVPLVCFLYGDEPFLVERAASALLERAIDPSLKDFNFNQYYGTDSKGTDILDAAQTLPMFADRRAVLVKRADQLKADACEQLLPYLKNPCPTTCLIMTGGKIDLRKKFFQEIKKLGYLSEHKKLYDNKLSGFIQEEAQRQGLRIERSAADMLAFLIGNNLQELCSQIEKLAVFAGQRTQITQDDVTAIASSSKAYSIFECARHLGMRDLQGALRSLTALLRNGEEVPMMIGALARHFRQLWRVRELSDRKVAKADIAREAGIAPFFLDEMLQQAKNFNRNGLRDIFDELYRCDCASKSGGGQPSTLMQGLAVRICSGNGNDR